jgi:glutathione S-transferase
LQAPIFFKGEREVTPEVREKLKSTLQHLESFLRGRNYFGGEEPSLADISILSNLVQVKNAFGDIGKMPNISAWYERCSSLPGYYDNLAGGEIIAEFFEKSGMKLAPLE